MERERESQQSQDPLDPLPPSPDSGGASPTFDKEFSEALLILDCHLIRSIVCQCALVDGENSFLPHILKHIPGVRAPITKDTAKREGENPRLLLGIHCRPPVQQFP